MDNPDERSDISDELHSIEDDEYGFQAFDYIDVDSHSGVIRAVIDNDLEKLKKLQSEGKSLNITDNHGNTPLHIAIILNKNVIFDYLVQCESVNFDAEDFYGNAPLLVAVKQKREYFALRLIGLGADVMIMNNQCVTPLHYSVQFSKKVTLALIENGACINAKDYSEETPLHEAITTGDIEIVSLLLYHGADPSRTCASGLTAYMRSIVQNHLEIEKLLIDYVDDFNSSVTVDEMTTLLLARMHNSPLTMEIIRRGGDVNFNGHSHFDVVSVSAFDSLDVFSAVWKHFNYKKCWKSQTNIIIHFLSSMVEEINFKIIHHIIDHSSAKQLTEIADYSTKFPLVAPIAFLFYIKGLSEDFLYKLVCVLMCHNLQLYSIDLDIIYSTYGYCDTFKFLLHGDILIKQYSCYDGFAASLIYDLTKRVPFQKQLNDKQSTAFENVFPFATCPKYVQSLLQKCDTLFADLDKIDNKSMTEKIRSYILSFPTQPSLLELARNAARDHICSKYNVRHSRDFYTVLNRLPICDIYKKIISFEKPLYIVQSHGADFNSAIKRRRVRDLQSMFGSLIYESLGCRIH